MKQLGSKCFEDIMNQEKAWETVLQDKKEYEKVVESIRKYDIEKVIFTGCGSSYYIAQAGSFIFSDLTGIESKALPGSELLFYPDMYLHSEKKVLLFVVSKSGNSRDVNLALAKIKKLDNVISVLFTCTQKAPMVNNCDFTLYSRDGIEISPHVMTKSFTSLLLGLQLVSGLWKNNSSYMDELGKLSSYFKTNIEKWRAKIEDLVLNHEHNNYVFLGQGYCYGLANEAMLKMKEMAMENATEVFHSLEYRHGPLSVANDKTLVSLFIGAQSYDEEKLLCKDILIRKVNILLIGDRFDEYLKEISVAYIELQTGMSYTSIAPLLMVPNQLLAYYVAVKKGIDINLRRGSSLYTRGEVDIKTIVY